MEIHAGFVRLQFDCLIIQYNHTGWMVSRDGHVVVNGAVWDVAWASLTVAERARCISFTNQLR